LHTKLSSTWLLALDVPQNPAGLIIRTYHPGDLDFHTQIQQRSMIPADPGLQGRQDLAQISVVSLRLLAIMGKL
jgi:hypothetical protein